MHDSTVNFTSAITPVRVC